MVEQGLEPRERVLVEPEERAVEEHLLGLVLPPQGQPLDRYLISFTVWRAPLAPCDSRDYPGLKIPRE